jgi:KDO2-lipid IV(A) lauroyltransferase
MPDSITGRRLGTKPWTDKPLRYPLEALGVAVLFGLLRLLPLDWASTVGGWIGRTFGPRLAASRKALRNLALALPELDELARGRVLRDAWDNVGRTFAEYPHLATLIRDYDKRVELVGAEHLRDLAADGRPGLCIAGHFGNWELASMSCLMVGLDLTMVYRAANNPMVDRLMGSARKPLRGTMVPKGRLAAKELLAALKSGGHAGLLIDQKQNDGLPVPFFGRMAMTSSIAADLALRFEAPVVAIRVMRLQGAHFRVEAFPPLDLPDDRLAAMTKLNAVIESWVREAPAQWLWLHRRWPD